MALLIVPIRLRRREVLPPLAARLGRRLRAPVALVSPWFEPEDAFDASRGQYSSTALLGRLLEYPSDDPRVLGVAGVDLFIPVLTFVFGEAQLDGRAAVVSTARLEHEAYGLPANPAGLLDRLEKEAMHELGHTYGLVHCAAPACVMRSSTYVEEIDLKGPRLCNGCRAAAGLGEDGMPAAGR